MHIPLAMFVAAGHAMGDYTYTIVVCMVLTSRTVDSGIKPSVLRIYSLCSLKMVDVHVNDIDSINFY